MNSTCDSSADDDVILESPDYSNMVIRKWNFHKTTSNTRWLNFTRFLSQGNSHSDFLVENLNHVFFRPIMRWMKDIPFLLTVMTVTNPNVTIFEFNVVSHSLTVLYGWYRIYAYNVFSLSFEFSRLNKLATYFAKESFTNSVFLTTEQQFLL